jgi:hypothetical protein
MANQTLMIQSDLYEQLRQGLHDGTLAAALEPRGFYATFLNEAIIQVSIDPFTHAPAFRCGANPVYVFCLGVDLAPEGRERPAALPDDVARRIINALVRALAGMPGLTAHDHITLGTALIDGLDAAATLSRAESHPVPPARLLLDPGGDLIARARRVEQRLSREIDALDARYSRFRASIEGKVLLEPLQKIAHWAVFSDYLSYGRHRKRCGTAKTFALMESSADIAFEIGRMTAPHQPGAASTLDHALLKAVHRNLARPRAPQAYSGTVRAWTEGDLHAWRARRDPEADARGGLPNHETGKALDQHARLFGLSHWSGIHPVVRAAMAHADFLRIRPFWFCNQLTSRVATEIRLAECDWRGLPIALHLHKFQPVKRSRDDAGSEEADISNVRQLISVCSAGIALGRALAPIMLRLREELTNTLFPCPSSSQQLAVDAMLSNLCVRPGDLLTPDVEADQLAHFLEPAVEAGLLVDGPRGECRSWIVEPLRTAIMPRRRSQSRPGL